VYIQVCAWFMDVSCITRQLQVLALNLACRPVHRHRELCFGYGNRSLSSARMCTPHVDARVHVQNDLASYKEEGNSTRSRRILV
jgi:hypothetical protein